MVPLEPEKARTSSTFFRAASGTRKATVNVGLGSASIGFTVSQLTPALSTELDYLLADFIRRLTVSGIEVRIRSEDDSGQFLLSYKNRVEARSSEPRNLLPWAESLIHALILDSGTGHLMFHGSVVAHRERAVWLSGPSGSGKSTLCMELVTRPGYCFISDDTALWNPQSGSLGPYPRPIRLKLDADDLFSNWWHLGLRFEVDYLDSTLWYFNPVREFPISPSSELRTGVVVHCTYQAGEPMLLEPSSRARGLCELLENAHLTPSHTRAELFSAAAELASGFTFCRLTYNDCHQAADLIGDLLARND